jgi:hypothetical protein
MALSLVEEWPNECQGYECMADFPLYRRVDDCEELKANRGCMHEITIHDLSKQSDKIDKFIEEAEPLMDYIKAEIDRNNRRAALYQKITEHVLGASAIAIFAVIGSWLYEKIKSDMGIK